MSSRQYLLPLDKTVPMSSRQYLLPLDKTVFGVHIISFNLYYCYFLSNQEVLYHHSAYLFHNINVTTQKYTLFSLFSDSSVLDVLNLSFLKLQHLTSLWKPKIMTALIQLFATCPYLHDKWCLVYILLIKSKFLNACLIANFDQAKLHFGQTEVTLILHKSVIEWFKYLMYIDMWMYFWYNVYMEKCYFVSKLWV